MSRKYKKEMQVNCPKCGWVDQKDVEFLNIEEDFQGADVLTFKCLCGKVRKSRIYG
jgi:hypothetical protein